jgi:hypothetical protein
MATAIQYGPASERRHFAADAEVLFRAAGPHSSDFAATLTGGIPGKK